MRGIYAVDIETGVGLGKTLGLRVAQHIGKIPALALHFRQDEIAGAVEDAIYPVDPVGRRAIAQPLNHRNTACDCGLEFQRGVLCLGQRAQFGTMMRDHRLVGRHQRSGVAQSLPRQGQRGSVRSADQLDDNIDVGRSCQLTHVVDPPIGGDVDTAILGPVARIDRDNLYGASGAARDQRGIFLRQADHAGADGAEAGKSDAKRFGHSAAPPRANRQACLAQACRCRAALL